MLLTITRLMLTCVRKSFESFSEDPVLSGLIAAAYPENPNSEFRTNTPPAEQTVYWPAHDSETVQWKPVGPFPRAYDFYGDGSLYIVDAPGHLPGHLNVLARTSADGSWIYLAGDSAHDWRIITGEAKIATEPFCIHTNKEQAEAHIARIRELRANPRVRVLLAHDVPWYEENKGGDAYWPGEIKSL